MFVDDCLQVNEQGHLTIGGCDTVRLAERYGTPLYVMDEATIRRNLSDYRRSIEENYENGGMVAYASKACSFKEMYRIVMSEGCAADVVSGGELYTAMQVGFPPERLYFHGNNKTDYDIEFAIDSGVGYFVIDNFEEIDIDKERQMLIDDCNKQVDNQIEEIVKTFLNEHMQHP